MVYTPGLFTNESPICPMTSTPVKKPSAIKSLFIFTNILDVKNKTATRLVGATKYKRKEIKYWTTPWALKQKLKGGSKINDHIKRSLYNWIIHNPQVVQSPIVNDCLKVKVYGHTELQLVPKLLMQFSVIELHNSLVIYKYNGEIKEARDVENNILISDYTLCSLFPPQF